MVEFFEILRAWSPVCYAACLPGVAIWLIIRALPRYLPRAARFVLWSAYAFILFLGCAMPSLVMALTVWHAQPEQGGILLMDTVGAPTQIRQTAVTPGGVETEGLLPYPAGQAPAPLNALHSRGGEWHGRDYVRECGAPLHAPFSGTVTRGGAGVKDSWGNPYMYLKSADGRYQMLLMHGDYVVSAGQRIEYGQYLGGTNLHGYFIGSRPICHDHLSLLDNGVEVDPEKYRAVRTETAVAAPVPARDLAGLSSALTSLGYSPQSSLPLRVSHYNPKLGGTNCDHDCNTMSSGDNTWSWTGGKNGVYAAACPPAWPFGTRFSYGGATYECRDRGGWIQCYAPGERDKAITHAHSNGYLTSHPAIAETNYCWVDLYNTPPVGYGTLAYDWQFIK